MTYNKYVTKSIIKNELPSREVDGVVVYSIRRPRKDEVVLGYTNFSGNFVKDTDTQIANSLTKTTNKGDNNDN